MAEWGTLLGATVLSVLGQGIGVGMAAFIVLRAAGSEAPRLRHVVAQTGMLLLAAGFIATLVGLTVVRSRALPVETPGTPGAPAEPLLWLARLWVVVAVLGVGRLGLGLWEVWRLGRRGRAVSGEALLQTFAEASARTGGTARLMVAPVDSPCAAGWFRPTVFVPPGFGRQLGRDHQVAIMIHELAHVRRRDYAWVVAGSVVDVLVGFHPVTRWLARVAGSAREEACDDVVTRSVEAMVYARALERLERSRVGTVRLAPAMAPTTARILRVLRPGAPRRGPIVCAIGCALAVLTILALVSPADIARRGQALAAALPLVRIQATDGAGRFTMSLRSGRVVAATVAGEPVPRAQLVQRGRTVDVLEPGGRTALRVQVHEDGDGISWQARPPRR